MYRDNRLKARLRAGEKAIGCWLFMPGAEAAELLSLVGFDALFIDQEHTPGDVHALVHQLRAVQASGVTTLVRVPWNEPVYIKRVLDAGVEGVVVPMVETVEQAAAAVAACRYPPDGIRGVAHPVVRASDYGMAADYAARAADNLMVVCQIETAKGVANVADIAAVDGVDMLFLGPGDLAASIGKSGWADEDVIALIGRVEQAAAAADVWLGGIVADPAETQAMFARGYDLVTPATDVWLLREGARAILKRARGD